MPRPIALGSVKSPALIFLSAALLSLPFHFSFLWPLSLVAFLPYFVLLRDQPRGRSTALSYAVGLFFWALTGYWLNYVNVFGFVLLSAYMAVYFGLFGFFAARYFSTREERVRAAENPRTGFYLAAGWVCLEWVRGWMFSGLPWALLGESQWKNRPFIQIADITGVWGVSFAVFLANYFIYRLVSGAIQLKKKAQAEDSLEKSHLKKRWIRDLVCFVLFLAVVLGYGFYSIGRWDAYLLSRDPKPVIRVSVLQGNVPQHEKWNRRVRDIIFEKYKRLTLMSANEKTDLIVWPETSFPGILEDEPLMATQLRSTIRHTKTATLVGVPTLGSLEDGFRFYNTALLFETNGEIQKAYHKTHLVPFGEYIPMEPLLGFVRHFVEIGRFNPGKEKTLFTARSQSSQPFFTAKFAALICYEDIFPGLVRDFVFRGADFLVNITNDAWFGRSTAPYQHAQGSVFRAVENRVPVIRSTNTGYSCFIDATGRVFASVQEQGQEIMVTGHRTASVVLKKNKAFYTRFGDIFLGLCLALLILGYRESVYNKS